MSTFASSVPIVSEAKVRRRRLVAGLVCAVGLMALAGGVVAAVRPHSAAASNLAVSPAAATAVQVALGQVGKPYIYGATGLDAFDCSGLTQYAWARAGVRISRTAAAQWSALPHVAAGLDSLAPGDLVFYEWGRNGRPNHVAMYIGGGQMVEAAHSRTLVRVAKFRATIGAARPGVAASGGSATPGTNGGSSAASPTFLTTQLGSGQAVWSPTSGYSLTMQTNGDLVVRAPGNRPVWSSGTNIAGSVAVLQGDGNLVVVAPGNRAVWSSGTAGHPSSVGAFQDDGNFVVIAPGNVALWSTNTANR